MKQKLLTHTNVAYCRFAMPGTPLETIKQMQRGAAVEHAEGEDEEYVDQVDENQNGAGERHQCRHEENNEGISSEEAEGNSIIIIIEPA